MEIKFKDGGIKKYGIETIFEDFKRVEKEFNEFEKLGAEYQIKNHYQSIRNRTEYYALRSCLIVLGVDLKESTL